MSFGDKFDDDDLIVVIRGKHAGEFGVVLFRLKVHDEFVLVQLEDEDDPYPFLDAEIDLRTER